MNVIEQHIPNFVEGEIPKSSEFDTVERLLAIPWVAQYAFSVDDPIFCKTRHGSQWLLLVYGTQPSRIFRPARPSGTPVWWVVGYLSDGESLDLPLWEDVRAQREQPTP